MKTSSGASWLRRRSGHRPPPLHRTVRVRPSRLTPSSPHHIPLRYRASAGRLPRPRRPNGRHTALGSHITYPSIRSVSPFHSRAPPPSRGNCHFYTHPSRGNCQGPLSEFIAFFCSLLLFFSITPPPPPPGGGGGGGGPWPLIKPPFFFFFFGVFFF